jgi:sorting nexin-41/42
MLIPKTGGKLKVPDEEDRYFTEMEAAAKEYEQVIGAGLEKVVRRLIKRYSELSKDYEALGGAYNAFSLNESGGSLPLAIERVGQASDGTYLSLQELVYSQRYELTQVLGLSSSFAEPLAESSQFAEILRQVLKYRRQKALQLELTKDTLQSKRASLSTLEKSEQEARRIEGALARIEGSQIIPRQPPPQPAAEEPPSSPEQERDEEEVTSPSSSPKKPKKRLSGVGKVFGFGKLNYAMKGIIDADPETTRRNNIGKTREAITQVFSLEVY